MHGRIGLLGQTEGGPKGRGIALGQVRTLKPHRVAAIRVDDETLRGPAMTLEVAAAAGVRLIVWCKECRHQVEPDPAEMAARYGAETSVLDWRQRLVCSLCGSRRADMVLTGTKR